MGNSNCGCTKKMTGGSSCKTRKIRRRRKIKKRVKKQRGGCGCDTMSGGYKYDRKSSMNAVKRLKNRVSKDTKTRHKRKIKHKKTKRNYRRRK
jgi:hypothetical protein